MKHRFLTLLLPLALTAGAAPALAAAPAPVQKNGSGDITVHTQHANLGIRFGDRSRQTCEPVHTRRGHYEFVTEQVWVEGATRRVYVPAEYRTVIDPCGRRRQVCIRPAYYKTVCDPGHYETRMRRVWVPYRPVITPGRDRHARGDANQGRRRGRGRF